jgi:hypothetical protein
VRNALLAAMEDSDEDDEIGIKSRTARMLEQDAEEIEERNRAALFSIGGPKSKAKKPEERETGNDVCVCMYVYIYIYIYIVTSAYT